MRITTYGFFYLFTARKKTVTHPQYLLIKNKRNEVIAMGNQTIYVDKPYETWTLDEKFEAINAVFNYLKYDGISDPLDENKRELRTKNNRRVQHVSHFVTHKSNETTYGFSDELVFVLDSETRDTKSGRTITQGKQFMGMHWTNSIDTRLQLLDQFDVDVIRRALFAVMMHEGLKSL